MSWFLLDIGTNRMFGIHFANWNVHRKKMDDTRRLFYESIMYIRRVGTRRFVRVYTSRRYSCVHYRNLFQLNQWWNWKILRLHICAAVASALCAARNRPTSAKSARILPFSFFPLFLEGERGSDGSCCTSQHIKLSHRKMGNRRWPKEVREVWDTGKGAWGRSSTTWIDIDPERLSFAGGGKGIN